MVVMVRTRAVQSPMDGSLGGGGGGTPAQRNASLRSLLTPTPRRQLDLRDSPGSLRSGLAQVALDEDQDQPEILRYREAPDSAAVEELRARGHRATVSRGPAQPFKVLLSWRTPFPIAQALWFRFPVRQGHIEECLGLGSGPGTEAEGREGAWDSVCLLGGDGLMVQAADGRSVASTLPFAVAGAWETPLGLLVQRRFQGAGREEMLGEGETVDPLLYSLSHPLDEWKPVLVRSPGRSGVAYAAQLDLEILWTSLDPPLLLAHSRATGRHSVYLLKAATRDERVAAVERLGSTLGSLVDEETPSQRARHTASSLAATSTQQSTNASALTSTSQIATGSTLTTSGDASGATPQGRQSGLERSGVLTRSATAKLRSMAEDGGGGAKSLVSPALRRILGLPSNRRAVNGSGGERTRVTAARGLHDPVGQASPHATPSHSHHASAGSATLGETGSSVGETGSLLSAEAGAAELGLAGLALGHEEEVPMIPDLCLQHLWTEPANTPSSHGPASKAFLTQDLLGQRFLCYVVGCGEARLLRLTLTGQSTATAAGQRQAGEDAALLPGALHSLPALDAAPIPDLHALLLIDPRRNLQAFSGASRLCPVHLASAALLDSSEFSVSVHEGVLASSRLESPAASLPALSASKAPPPPSARRVMMDQVSGLSPVPEATPGSLGEPAGLPAAAVRWTWRRRVVVTTSTGRQLEATLPPFARLPALRRCLDVVAWTCLPKDKALALYAAWYEEAAEEKGWDPEAEWRAFLRFLLRRLGLPVGRMRLFAREEEEANEAVSSTRRGVVVRSKSSFPSPLPSPATVPKRIRLQEEEKPGDEAWHRLLKSPAFQANAGLYGKLFPGLNLALPSEKNQSRPSLSANSRELLFGHAGAILHALQLCLEEMLLEGEEQVLVDLLVASLHAVASAFGWEPYLSHYENLRPKLRESADKWSLPDKAPSAPAKLLSSGEPPSLRLWCRHALRPAGGSQPGSPSKGQASLPPFPLGHCLIGDAAWRTPRLVFFAGLVCGQIHSLPSLERVMGKSVWAEAVHDRRLSDAATAALRQHSGRTTAAYAARLRALFTGLDWELSRLLHQLPTGVAVVVADAVFRSAGAILFKREASLVPKPAQAFASQMLGAKVSGQTGTEQDDGLSCLERSENPVIEARWRDDQRTWELRKLLDSSSRRRLRMPAIPDGLPEAEVRESVESSLQSFFARLFALPFARGMVSLSTKAPVLGEPFDVPDLNIKEAKTETTSAGGYWAPANVRPCPYPSLQEGALLPAQAKDWAEFHNGAAAGLALEAAGSGDATAEEWLVAGIWRLGESEEEELGPAEAGLVLGLGLRGYLGRLSIVQRHSFMQRYDPLLSSALLLGQSAAQQGSMDFHTFKALAVCCPFLLPPTLLELQVDQQIQTVAVLGLGLLFAESGTGPLAEALFWEMGKAPSADNDPWLDRQAYALTAGLSLGLIHLGQGPALLHSHVPGTTASMLELLELYIKGGSRDEYRETLGQAGQGRAEARARGPFSADAGVPRPGHQAPEELEAMEWLDSLNSGWRDPKPSNYYQEGDQINTDVTAPGATLALGLLFLGTGNEEVSRLLSCPSTLAGLDEVRPDLLLLRSVARCLVEWEWVVPSREWVEAAVAPAVSEAVVAVTRPQRDEGALALDEESVTQAYVNVVAGTCFGLGLRFAGSANEAAFRTLLHFLRLFLPKNLPETGREEPADERGEAWRNLVSLAGPATMKACLRPVLLAMGMVMAGTGDLDALRVLRFVCGINESYGHHVAAHLALGLLFLGGGRASLKTDKRSVAALLVSLYPRMAADSADNRAFPQLFRHLHCLAAEKRLFVARERDTGALVPLNIRLTYAPSRHYGPVEVAMECPVMLPELALLDKVEAVDERYWPRSFSRGDSAQWAELSATLLSGGEVVVDRRQGFFSRSEDPAGLQSRSARLRFGHQDQLQLPFPSASSSDEEQEVGKTLGAGLEALCEESELPSLAGPLRHLLSKALCPEAVDEGLAWDVEWLAAGRRRLAALLGADRASVLHPELLELLRNKLRSRVQ